MLWAAIELALDYLPDETQEIELWRLDLAHDEVALARQKTALDRARSARRTAARLNSPKA